MRKGAAQDLCLQQTGQIQITGVFCLAGNFVETVDARSLLTALSLDQQLVDPSLNGFLCFSGRLIQSSLTAQIG